MNGIPGLRGAEHIGFTVPDMDQAHDFFVNVIGCEFVYELGPWVRDDDWFAEHLNVDPRSVIRRLNKTRLPHATAMSADTTSLSMSTTLTLPSNTSEAMMSRF